MSAIENLGVLEWHEVPAIFLGLEQDRVKPDRVGTLQEGFHALVGGHSRGIATAKLLE